MATRFEGRDFLELRQEMINFLKERLGDQWTDEGESDDLMTMVEMLAYLADNVHYYIDAQKRESDIVTAVLERNVIQKATRDGYKPHMYCAATGHVHLAFSILDQGVETAEDSDEPVVDPGIPYDIVIPRGTVFQTSDAENPEDNMQVVVLNDFRIPAGSTYADIPVSQGRLRTETFTRADISQSGYIRLSTDKVSSPSLPYSTESLPNTARLIYDGEWTEVDDVYTDFRVGKLFSIHLKYLHDKRFNIVQLPYNWPLFITDLSAITVEYLETDGRSGNISSNRIDKCTTTIRDESGKAVQCTISSSEIKSGVDPEDVNSIKANFKSAIKDLETIVTLDDYEDFVRLKYGVECVAIDWRTAPSIVTDARVVRILVDISDEKKAELKALLEQHQGRGDSIEIASPIYKDYEISATVKYDQAIASREGVTGNDIIASATSIIEYYYKTLPQRGNCHFRSEIISFIHKASEAVKSVILESPTEDVLPSQYEIPRFTNIKLIAEVV